MALLSEKELTELATKAKEYDFVRFSSPDFNGIPRGKTVPGRYSDKYITKGLPTFVGTFCYGPRSEVPSIKKITEANYGDANFIPATNIIDMPWASQGNKYNVGAIICEPHWSDGTPQQASPRFVARKQIERLDTLGYQLFSGFELEFIVVDKDTKKPVFDGVEFESDLVLNENTPWLYDVEEQLRSVDINIGQMHTEYSPGQFEFAMTPKYGIQTFDDMFIMKQALRDILPKHGLQPTFMTRPFSGLGGSSGLHFNHSLWDKEGKSAFYDASKPNNMSDIMRYWIGGLMEHIHPLLVLCSPTPNCFRRLHRPWAPHQADWDIDHRMTSIRAKTSSVDSALVENRLPSSAANPYLVAAATIAAGIDGIQNKIEPPPKGTSEENLMLTSYEECICALIKDDVLVEALGSEFVKWWVAMKSQFEMKKFKNQTMVEVPPEVEMEAERNEYFKYI